MRCGFNLVCGGGSIEYAVYKCGILMVLHSWGTCGGELVFFAYCGGADVEIGVAVLFKFVSDNVIHADRSGGDQEFSWQC